jgi:hypothetical protein
MNVMDFKSASDLTDYVNDSTIAQAKIVAIIVAHRRWWLFWYT